MEATDLTRSSMVNAVKTQIEGGTTAVGKFDFYDKDGAFIVTLLLANPCMTITAGVGHFTDTTPYLRGTVLPGNSGVANRWAFKNHDDLTVVTGSCGDPTHTGKDIQFNTLTWAEYDNITVTGLTITQPAGSNSYIP